MNCMKCGRKLKDEQVFCPECMAVMEAYPVKPNTPIQLPPQSPTPATPPKYTRRRIRKPEEQIARLRSTVRWLVLALAVALLAFGATALMMFRLLDGPGFGF